jgi:NADH-quinone oxidoreductase subunit F
MTRIVDERTFDLVRDAGRARLLPPRPRIAVGMGTCGTGNGAEGIYHAFANAIERRGLDVQLVQTGCFGFCAEEPLVNVWHPGQSLIILRRVQTNHVAQVLDGMAGAGVPENLLLCKIEK